jgi:NitT/TauT family transport system substrate-binding protein
MQRRQALATVALATIAGATPQIVAAQPLTKVRFCGVATDDLAPVYWAIEKGLYRKAGLDVEFIPMPSGTAATNAIVAGAYEIGKGSAVSAFIAYLKGIPLVLIANGVLWETNNPWTMGLVAADSTLKTGADLNGKVIGVPGLSDLAAISIREWITQNGGDPNLAKWIEVPNSLGASAVEQHRVDVVNLNEPQVHAALDSGKLRKFAPFLGSISSSYVLTNYFCKGDWAQKNKGIVERFVKTTYETALYTNKHPADTAPLVADMTKIPVEVIRTMVRAHSATTSEPSMVQPVIEVIAKYGLIPKTFPAKDIYFAG